MAALSVIPVQRLHVTALSITSVSNTSSELAERLSITSSELAERSITSSELAER